MLAGTSPRAGPDPELPEPLEPLRHGGSASAPGSHEISPSTVRKLDKQGPDGKATAAAAAATAPAPTPARDLGSSSDSGPGMGWVLPVILALALAGALAVVVMRRRGAPPGPA